MANPINVEGIGIIVTALIKQQPWFPISRPNPYKRAGKLTQPGNLKFNATKGRLIDNNTWQILFDSSVAPYVEYLEEGTEPHDIPRAFGRPLPFGIGGRFDGKFHPGSHKHEGFIKNKSVNAIVDYIAAKYGGRVEVL